ncbi:MAG TPA: hypothetical protein V6D12_00725 [Candidatus Obscuribacterales bacterium]
MPGQFTESIVEAATLQWLEGLGYTTLQVNDEIKTRSRDRSISR